MLQKASRHRPSAAPVGRNEIAGDKHEEAHGQHAVDAHHGAVGVVGGELRADLVVADDRQVDEEAEHAGPEEVPKADGDEEHHRPFVREGRAGGAEHRALRMLAAQRMNRQASNVNSTSGITSMAEKNAPSDMWTAGAPLK